MAASLSLTSSIDEGGIMVASNAGQDSIISVPKYPRPSGIGTDKLSKTKNFNLSGVIMAALVFIIVLSWFELLRLIIQSYFINTRLVLCQMWAYLTYTLCTTIFAAVILFLIYMSM